MELAAGQKRVAADLLHDIEIEKAGIERQRALKVAHFEMCMSDACMILCHGIPRTNVLCLLHQTRQITIILRGMLEYTREQQQ
jgi:hypothetical protein